MEAALWESALAEKGEHVRPLFEAQLHAYDYILDLATQAQPLSEAAIRALHAEVCRAQATYRVITAIGPQEHSLPKGEYKTLPNHVRTRKGTDHAYAPVDVTHRQKWRVSSESFEAKRFRPLTQSGKPRMRITPSSLSIRSLTATVVSPERWRAPSPTVRSRCQS